MKLYIFFVEENLKKLVIFIIFCTLKINIFCNYKKSKNLKTEYPLITFQFFHKLQILHIL